MEVLQFGVVDMLAVQTWVEFVAALVLDLLVLPAWTGFAAVQMVAMHVVIRGGGYLDW